MAHSHPTAEPVRGEGSRQVTLRVVVADDLPEGRALLAGLITVLPFVEVVARAGTAPEHAGSSTDRRSSTTSWPP